MLELKGHQIYVDDSYLDHSKIIPLIKSIIQLFPRVTLIFTAFLDGSTVSVVYYFSKLLVQMFPIYQSIKYYNLLSINYLISMQNNFNIKANHF